VTDRDLFANFDRVRREVDELFGDVIGRTPLARRRGGFSPAVDVAYASDPPRAIVTAELAGIDIGELDLEIQGRELVLSGVRGAAQGEDDVYQQVEIERGRFRRVVQLAHPIIAEDAQATYDDGMLRVELPLAPTEPGPTQVPIESTKTGHQP
jgi:HSP20 family protein